MIIATGLSASLIYLGITLFRLSMGSERTLIARQQATNRLQEA